MKLAASWGEAAKACGGRLTRGRPEAPLDRIETDTRTLTPGAAFWALKGERFDAHDLLAKAGAAGGWVAAKGRWPVEGAPAQVLEVDDTLKALQAFAAWHRSRFKLPVAAVAGSNGKTTTKELLRLVLEADGPTCATRGNLNNHIGLPLSLLELGPEHRWGVFELGSSALGEVKLLASLAKPRLGVLTSIAAEHMEFFKTMEAVFEGECELIGELPPDGPVVYAAEDPWLSTLKGRLGPRGRSFGFSEAAEMRIEPREDGMELFWRGEAFLKAPLRGRILQLNGAAAALAGAVLGVSAQDIARGLAAFKPVGLRMEARRHASGAELWLDAYNANPGSMRASLSTFCELYPKQERYAVLGDMRELGETGPSEHFELGRALKDWPVERFFLVGPEMKNALEGAKAAGLGAKVEHHPELGPELAKKVAPLLKPGSALLLKASRGVGLERLLEQL